MQDKNKERALRYLNYRMRSEKEMRDYLQKNQVEEAEIDDIIDYLYSYNYLNDTEYAGCFIRDKLRFHPCGRRKCAFELQQKGIDAFVIEAVMEEEYPQEFEKALIAREVEKCKSKGKSHQQTLRYLYGKGYSTNLLYDIERF